MMFKAKLIKVSEFDEQEVILEINCMQFICCAIFCPYKIRVGSYYNIELDVQFISEPKIKELQHEEFGADKIGLGYQYNLKGKLCGDVLDLGVLKLKIKELGEFFWYDGKFIEVMVHGIWASFLVDNQRVS